MIKWLTIELVLAVHDRQLAEHGGLPGVRDDNLLQSALARPQQLSAYSEVADIFELAASLCFGLARNHPFNDGNKRTAWVACRTFLLLNGFQLQADAAAKYLNMLALAEGRMEEKEFAEWLRSVADGDSNQLHERAAKYQA